MKSTIQTFSILFTLISAISRASVDMAFSTATSPKSRTVGEDTGCQALFCDVSLEVGTMLLEVVSSVKCASSSKSPYARVRDVQGVRECFMLLGSMPHSFSFGFLISIVFLMMKKKSQRFRYPLGATTIRHPP